MKLAHSGILARNQVLMVEATREKSTYLTGTMTHFLGLSSKPAKSEAILKTGWITARSL